MNHWSVILLAQSYWKPDNPMEDVIFFIIFGVLVFIGIVAAIVDRIKKGSTSLGKPSKQPTLGRTAFRRKAMDRGFSAAEADFLDMYARQMGITNPQSVFGTREQLDTFLRNAFKYIERHADTEAEAEQHKHQLFVIREALGARLNAGTSVVSTKQLKQRTPISITTAKGSSYSSVLVINDDRFMYLEPALDAFGQPLRFARGSKLTLFFYVGNHVGYSVQVKSRGLMDMQGRELLVVSHSDRITPLPSRRNQRASVRIPARFYLVHVHAAKNKGKVVKTIQIEKAAVAGMILDISGGGLSMQTMSPANAGQFVKLEFDLGSGARMAYATVVRVSKTRNAAHMHVKFVKAGAKLINDIRSLVYGYD